MKNPSGGNLGGQIDGIGRVTASSYYTLCGYSYVWQKR
jgi:hypothetical protein